MGSCLGLAGTGTVELGKGFLLGLEPWDRQVGRGWQYPLQNSGAVLCRDFWFVLH